MYRRRQGRGATGEAMKWRTEEREPGPLEENSRGFTRCPDVYDFRDLFLYFTSGPVAYRRTILNLRPRRFFSHGKGPVVSLMADALHAVWGLVRPNEEMRSMPSTSRSVIQLFKHEHEQRAARMRAAVIVKRILCAGIILLWERWKFRMKSLKLLIFTYCSWSHLIIKSDYFLFAPLFS